ncbi:nectin-3-like [Astyanax mexicanus]|uniref:Nectin-3-like n=1 Tax=Astyanax mexicanus TaxID=7994 RepID=A0A8T2MI99_ASTMX|nr:nectin-3-like [Astyanax mexicanus]
MILIHTFTLLLLLTLCPGSGAGVDWAEETVYALIGQSVDLICRVNSSGNVIQSQWSRCPDRIIVVFRSEQKYEISDREYQGRVSIQQYHTLTLQSVQRDDFGMYCCKLITFPSGTLEGRVHLLETPDLSNMTTTSHPSPFTHHPAADTPRNISGEPNTTVSHNPQQEAGLSVMMMVVYISCGSAGALLLLLGIIIFLLCRRRRRRVLRNPVYVPGQSGTAPPNLPQTNDPFLSHAPQQGDTKRVWDEDEDDEDEEMYLNVPKKQ